MRSLVFVVILFLLFPYSFAQQPTCDYKVEILVDSNEFESQDFKWRMRATKIEGKSTNITGTAEIEDSNGKTIKTYKPWTSQAIAKQKTSNEYSPNLKPGNYKIISEISVECDDTNKDNNADAKEIKIKGKIEETKSKNKEIKIKNEEIDDTTAIDNTLDNQKTQSNKNIITTKTQKSTTNEEAESTIELKPQKINQNTQKTQESQPITANIIQSPQNTETVYASSNERAKGWIMVFLLTLSILLNIILIWKR